MGLPAVFDILERVSQNNLESILSSIIAESNLSNSTILIHSKDKDELGMSNIGLTLFDDKECEYDGYSSFPIYYQRKEIGLLNIPTLDIDTDQGQEYIPDTKNKLALLINRHLTNTISKHCLGKGQELVGLSEHVLSLERFIERASCIDCPVVIKGESGCEKLSIASAIHYNSDRKEEAFIELNCSAVGENNFHEKLYRYAEMSKGGTLFLSEIDFLDRDQQNILVDFLCVSSLQPDNQVSANSVNVRLIVSSTKDLKGEVRRAEFSQFLFSSFNFLEVEVPSLRERKEDIPYILQALLMEYQIFPSQSFSEDAKHVIYSYSWPGNYSELNRVVIRLVTLAKNDVIGKEDIAKHSPELLMTAPPHLGHSFLAQNLIDDLKSKKFTRLNYLHLALQKSLIYIANNYRERITLQGLANNACVSPSHLSYLFKVHLNKSFKKVLIELRLGHAKSVFVARPSEKITSVSYEVGFGDLSYFEKAFKQQEGMTPRQYKNKVKSILPALQ
ncbi:AraC family transcriptional regulator [Sinobacterium caligoides]|uniref:AraC family transcriptional regulator n=1 Tax=Sinobacterium caligoides TaxID=933926 RepID=A0A3N2DYX3_9GAMM|nr:AraC family transcriptional regulator [Sinobacterium caligoides]ROS04882.1 AraC family transcriptional regulator [Sinobacterium caligoides]